MTGSSAATPAVAQRRICAALLFELCRLVKLLLLNRILLCKKILCLDCITTGIEMAEWTARTYFYFSSSIPHNLFILAIHNSNIVWIIAQNIVYPTSPEGCIVYSALCCTFIFTALFMCRPYVHFPLCIDSSAFIRNFSSSRRFEYRSGTLFLDSFLPSHPSPLCVCSAYIVHRTVYADMHPALAYGRRLTV